jgi:alkyl sulfatase BDS1-like metallo-beta-lactamase superfamily hydrolase
MHEAEQKLKDFAQSTIIKKKYRISDRITHFVGYGHSNAILVEGDTSLILIDTLDSNERAKRLRHEIEAMTGKVVKTLIFTHGHPDHRGGSAAFQETVEEVIAFVPRRPLLKYTDKIQDVLNRRASRQFGYTLTEEEVITQGLGMREGRAVQDGTYDFLAPTTIYRNEERVVREIDGVTLELISAVGETDDQLFVWFPDEKVLCCGDNFYACWPNLYAIRGGQYRDVAAWVDSLTKILSFPSVALLPGHFQPVLGEETIRETLTNYRDAIESVLIQTLECINQGKSEEETVRSVALPEQLRDLPYLGEYYGTIQWSIRSIYHGYLGWFDGNPTNLNRVPAETYAKEILGLISDPKIVFDRIERLQADGDDQLACELCDVMIYAGVDQMKAKQLKAKSLMVMAKRQTSSNGRHYDIASAYELLEETK